jgi:hypothetical protein
MNGREIVVMVAVKMPLILPGKQFWLPACSHSFHSPDYQHYETVLLNMLAIEKIRMSL